MAILPITSTSMNRATYVLPVPDNELEFGNFKQNCYEKDILFRYTPWFAVGLPRE